MDIFLPSPVRMPGCKLHFPSPPPMLSELFSLCNFISLKCECARGGRREDEDEMEMRIIKICGYFFLFFFVPNTTSIANLRFRSFLLPLLADFFHLTN